MKIAIAAVMISVSSLAAGAVQAADQSTLTRAQVIAEMHEAKSMGLISHGEQAYPPAVVTESVKSRDQVLAELAAAREAGQISAGAVGYPHVAQSESNLTRAQVRAELFDYLAAGNHTPAGA
ncbi:MAG TPA: DUF4148 domain-containing protein [Candidimonas sp.]|nr:DUF4148 domain-containing protein [Candidimonas sp.]